MSDLTSRQKPKKTQFMLFLKTPFCESCCLNFVDFLFISSDYYCLIWWVNFCLFVCANFVKNRFCSCCRIIDYFANQNPTSNQNPISYINFVPNKFTNIKNQNPISNRFTVQINICFFICS